MILKLKPSTLPAEKFPVYSDNVMVLVVELGNRKRIEFSKFHNRPLGYWYDLRDLK